jgi:hypothetical protein
METKDFYYYAKMLNSKLEIGRNSLIKLNNKEKFSLDDIYYLHYMMSIKHNFIVEIYYIIVDTKTLGKFNFCFFTQSKQDFFNQIKKLNQPIENLIFPDLAIKHCDTDELTLNIKENK